MTEDEKRMTLVLASQFMAGEESVTQDMQPFAHAMAAEGRLADEAYITQLIFEEAKHMQAFRLWFDAIGQSADLQRAPSRRSVHTESRRLERTIERRWQGLLAPHRHPALT